MASSRPGNGELNARSRSGTKLVPILSLITVVAVLIGVAGLLMPKVFSYSNSQTVDDRGAAVGRATEFAVAYNTYDVSKVADYQKRLKGLLTPTYDKEFVKVTSTIFGALTDKKQTSTNAKVLGAAIESMDKDSAVALVAVDSAITNTDATTAVARHLRWRVYLVKRGGEWDIDKYESVGTLGASTGQPSAAPTDGSPKK